MKIRGVKWKPALFLALIFLFVLNLNFASSSIDSEIQKATSYAEDFETGNINYIQLLVYLSAVREEINMNLGATNKEMGGILKEEQLKSILGEPTEKTKWVWVENEEREIKLDKEASAWRKIIFDGKRIQIWINSWPSILKKGQEDTLVYRLNFEVNFKEPQDELNIEGKISEIKTLAENFNKNPVKENAEILAKESVNTEKIFEMYMRQNSGKCEDIMKSIFGTENRRANQKMFVQEITFFEGKNFEVIARIEMCDECEWKWINLNMWINGRGSGFKMPKEQAEEFSSEQFQNLEPADYKSKINEVLSETKSNLEQGDYRKIFSFNSKMQAINEAWNQKSNNVWQEVDKLFPKFEQMTKEQQSQLEEYWWIKQEQEKREKVNEIINKNYQERKEFYLNLFSGYEKKEFSFSQIEYEKRLVEEFREFGEEICDNNIDDNNNEKTDCSDEQCSGKKCGRQKVSIRKENQTSEEERDLFCIEGSCQFREEIIQEERSICGNHICEENETESCKEDCVKCEVYDAINCSGKIIFKGKDKEGCPLEPICINETDFCEKNEDCAQPLCGIAECIEKKCQLIALEECKEAECSDGAEKVQSCNNGDKIIKEICQEGIWKKTGSGCEAITEENESIGSPIIIEEPIHGNECDVKEDCGNENDVCSNGKCVALPEAIKQSEVIQEETEEQEEEEPEQSPQQEESLEQQSQEQPTEQLQEEQPEQQPQTEQSPQEQPPEEEQTEQQTETLVTGDVISYIKTITGKITGFVIGITGFDVEEAIQESAPQEQPQESPEREEPTQETQQETTQQQEPPQQEIRDNREQQDNQERERREEEEQDRQREEDRKRQKKECNNNCEKMCKDRLEVPCVNKCVFKENTNEMEDLEECKKECNGEIDIRGCVDDCTPKCMKGGDWWKEFEQKQEEGNKEEKGVFKAGGSCRTTQGNQKTEAFIYFDGWGEPFKQIQPLKQKYYSGGDADWCKKELENLLKQRKALEQGLNSDFVAWFFEKYLANSADEWEQHVSGIFEVYWKDVELSKQIAERMNCLDMKDEIQYNLINIKYETDFGKFEFWEEIKNTKIPSLDNEVRVVSPYMKIWIFPPKSFIIYEMKKAMKNHEFPGSPEQKMERENEEGPTAEEREVIKQDSRFMKQIKEISEKYGGNLNVAVRFVDNGTVVFNLYAQVNENDILKIKPMLPEEIPREDVKIDIEFQKLYDIIYIQEKDMRGERIESPPWDKKAQPMQKIKDMVNGVKTYFKARDMLDSAKIYPEADEKEIRSLLKLFFKMMSSEKSGEMKSDVKNEDIGKEKGVWEGKDKITGEVIAG